MLTFPELKMTAKKQIQINGEKMKKIVLDAYNKNLFLSFNTKKHSSPPPPGIKWSALYRQT